MCTVTATLMLLGFAGDKVTSTPTTPPAPLVLAEPFGLSPVPAVPTGFYRVSAYEVWQNLAVDRSGYFRPRVMYTPYGAYYRYNGQPYFWTTTKQLNFIPYGTITEISR